MQSAPADRTTAAEVRGLFEYDPMLGWLTWKSGGRIGLRAGCKTKRGYRQVKVNGVSYKEHRVIFLHVTGTWPTQQLDHQYGDRADNRMSQLRAATNAQNSQNKRTARSDSKTGLMGVSESRHGGFVSSIKTDGKRVHLGTFPDTRSASVAYWFAKAASHPFSLQP